VSLDAELAKLAEIVGAVDVPFETKSLDVEGDGTLILRGLAAGFNTDRMGEQFDAASFRAAFEQYLASNPVVTLNHELKKVLGKITSGRFTPQGVEVEAEIPKPDPGMPELTNAYNLIKSKVLKAFSVGGRWRRMPVTDDVEKLYPIEIVETTVAGVPVNPSALFEVTGVKALGGNMDAELARLADLTTGPSPLDAALERLRKAT
jgi:HK97 family phage prohead protease